MTPFNRQIINYTTRYNFFLTKITKISCHGAFGKAIFLHPVFFRESYDWSTLRAQRSFEEGIYGMRVSELYLISYHLRIRMTLQ